LRLGGSPFSAAFLRIRVEVFGEYLIDESCKRKVERVIDGRGYLKRAEGCLKGLKMQILGERLWD
jgi:hypothetical protein